MLTVRDMGTTDSGPAGLRRACHKCAQPVMWATAYLGRKLAFDPEPIPRKYDYDKTGWLPGLFEIDGRLRTVYAPLVMHPAVKRNRAVSVIMLHRCPDKAAA